MNIVEFLNSKGLTISCAESFTGGEFSSYITSFSNASKCFKGGLVCYSSEIKQNILGVDKDIILNFGTISRECCQAMVDNCLDKFKSDIAVSFTGNAGPNSSEDKPVGLIYIGLKYKDKNIVNELHLTGTREEIRIQAIKLVVELILTII